MPDDIRTEGQPSMASLVSGIVEDVQRLVRQEVALARREITEELNKAKTAAISMATAVFFAVFAGGFFILAAVHLLAWLTGIPLWGAYAIGGAILAAAAVVLFFVAKTKAEQIHVVPPQTAETLRENVQWIQNRT